MCVFNESQAMLLQNVQATEAYNKVFQKISIQIFSLTRLCNFDVLATCLGSYLDHHQFRIKILK